MLVQVALVSQTSSVSLGELVKVSAALQKQVSRDFAPIWKVNATVDSFATLGDVPLGYYNVGTEVQTTIRELCELILRMKQSSLTVTYKPYSADDARQFVKNRIGSRQRAERDLGFLYRFSLQEGLQKLMDWRIVSGIDRAAAVV